MRRCAVLARGAVSRATSPTTRLLLVYLSTLLLAHLARITIEAVDTAIQVEYYILDDHYVHGTTRTGVGSLVGTLAYVLALAIVMAWLSRERVVGMALAGAPLPGKAHLLGLVLAISIASVAAGNILARPFDVTALQAMAVFETTGYGYGVYTFAYFLGNIVGPHLTSAGFIVFYAMMAIACPREPVQVNRVVESPGKGERAVVLVSSTIHGVAFATVNILGISMSFSFVFMVVLACPVLVLVAMKRGKNVIMHDPFLVFLLVQLVVMLTASFIRWAMG